MHPTSYQRERDVFLCLRTSRRGARKAMFEQVRVTLFNLVDTLPAERKDTRFATWISCPPDRHGCGSSLQGRPASATQVVAGAFHHTPIYPRGCQYHYYQMEVP